MSDKIPPANSFTHFSPLLCCSNDNAFFVLFVFSEFFNILFSFEFHLKKFLLTSFHINFPPNNFLLHCDRKELRKNRIERLSENCHTIAPLVVDGVEFFP